MMYINLMILGFVTLAIITAFAAAEEAEELVKFYEEEEEC